MTRDTTKTVSLFLFSEKILKIFNFVKNNQIFILEVKVIICAKPQRILHFPLRRPLFGADFFVFEAHFFHRRYSYRVEAKKTITFFQFSVHLHGERVNQGFPFFQSSLHLLSREGKGQNHFFRFRYSYRIEGKFRKAPKRKEFFMRFVSGANQDVKRAIQQSGFYFYEVADRLGIHDCTLSKWLRRELSDEKKSVVLQAIRELKAENEK